MKTLIIHPEDSSTTFLKAVYQPVPDKTVITGGVTREQLSELIALHDRVMMLGHGCQAGLLSVGQFPGAGIFLVDNRLVPYLEKKKNSVFIWCNADHFVEYYELDGFYSGMFVSEVGEAEVMGLSEITQDVVDQSNHYFGHIAGKYINDSSPATICGNVKREYGVLVPVNPVVSYNHERLYHSQ
jgi:hypothetical protein